MIFNLKENTHELCQNDEKDFRSLCSALGLESVEIVTTYCLEKRSLKPRTLKVINNHITQRKYLTDSAKYIPKESTLEPKQCNLTNDLTQEQRIEKR